MLESEKKIPELIHKDWLEIRETFHTDELREHWPMGESWLSAQQESTHSARSLKPLCPILLGPCLELLQPHLENCMQVCWKKQKGGQEKLLRCWSWTVWDKDGRHEIILQKYAGGKESELKEIFLCLPYQ